MDAQQAKAYVIDIIKSYGQNPDDFPKVVSQAMYLARFYSRKSAATLLEVVFK